MFPIFLKFKKTFNSITNDLLGEMNLNSDHIVYFTVFDEVNKSNNTRLRVKLSDGISIDVPDELTSIRQPVFSKFIRLSKTYDSLYMHGLGIKYVNIGHIISITPFDYSMREHRIKTLKNRIKLTDGSSFDIIESIEDILSQIKSDNKV